MQRPWQAPAHQNPQKEDEEEKEEEPDWGEFTLCPNTNCSMSAIRSEDSFCKKCGIPVHCENEEVVKDIAAKQKLRLAPRVSAGIKMINLKSHLLTSEAVEKLQTSRKRGLDSMLRQYARKTEKDARMAGFKGHRDRTEHDAEYADKMAEYPPEFCDDVISELAHC